MCVWGFRFFIYPSHPHHGTARHATPRHNFKTKPHLAGTELAQERAEAPALGPVRELPDVEDARGGVHHADAVADAGLGLLLLLFMGG